LQINDLRGFFVLGVMRGVMGFGEALESDVYGGSKKIIKIFYWSKSSILVIKSSAGFIKSKTSVSINSI